MQLCREGKDLPMDRIETGTKCIKMAIYKCKRVTPFYDEVFNFIIS